MATVGIFRLFVHAETCHAHPDLRSCVNSEMGLGSHPILPPSIISHTVSVDVKHHVR